MREGIAHAYISLGQVLNSRGHESEAKASYKKAEKWGGKVPGHEPSAGFLDPKNNPPSVDSNVDPTVDTPPVKTQPTLSLKKVAKTNDNVTIPAHIFAENVPPPTVAIKLPEIDGRLSSTTVLACCLSLLNTSHSLDDVLEPAARTWKQAVEKDDDEHERLKILSQDVIRAYKRDEIKDAKVVAEVVTLAPVLEKDMFRDLLKEFYGGIGGSDLLDFHQLDGLAQLIQGADSGYLEADDLVKILGLLSKRLRETHQQSPLHIYQLTLAASSVLDAMADTKVEGLDRETLHEPLSSYLDALKGNSEPYLVFQAAYACQALLCVPDNESLWQATIRRTGKVIRGVSGLVSAVKGLDLNGFMDGLKDIQQGIAGATEVVQLVVTAFDGAKSLTESGQGFLDGIKEGFSFNRKCAWYSALRGADTLIRDGEFATFKRLMYRNHEHWHMQSSIKEWILVIVMKLSSSTEGVQQHAETLLHELESTGNAMEKGFIQACREKNLGSYPLKAALPSLATPSLLDRAQNKPDVEGTLRQLRKQRLKERGSTVYIHPQAKPGLQASDDQRFPLMERIQEFLDSEQKVFLLLGDSGAGKSTFNVHLECELWQRYIKSTGRIPLFINLPAIDKPEQDMIAKQLRKCEFTEPEIRELKVHRKFILICDGYDESQQTHNLYMSNRLNQSGEWNAQMVISCRSEYLGSDYRDRFQPVDRNRRPDPGMFQEAVITPFTSDQVRDYIKQYVSVHQPLWESKDYEQALNLIPGLKELVRNPFLMTLSLEVTTNGGPRSTPLGDTVALYDQFIEHWLERGKKRLSEKELSPQAKAAFESLIDEGFTQNGIDFLKRLAVAIYKAQGGQPVVKYSRFKDEKSWKTEFFSRKDEKQLLREACPLTRSGNQHRFIHRSLLEYGLALAIFDPNDWKEKPSETLINRRGSTSSVFSFHVHGSTDDEVTPVEQELDPDSPLVWRYFVNEPSVLQFLSERVQQEPVFKQQLFGFIEHSKADKKWRTAAANAITILVRAGVQFHGKDLRGIRIPGADLSYGVFDSAKLQGADLRQVNLRGAWLSQADLSQAQMAAVQFGELPFLKEDDIVFSCRYSPDGKSFALGLDSDIKVYSTSTWDRVRTLTGHSEFVRSVAFSPEGDRIVSGSYDDTARVWDIDSGSCTHILIGHMSGDVNGVAFSPIGDTVASASDDKTVRVWDVTTGDRTLILTGHTGLIRSVAYSPKGDQIASGGEDSTVRLWDIKAGVCLRILRGHTRLVWEVAYSPQGDRVASASGDSTVRIWDVEKGYCCRVLTGHNSEVNSVAFSPQRDMIASASDDKTVRLWDAETGFCRQVLTGHSSLVRCVVFSPKGDHIACGSDDNTVRLWDVGSGGTRQIAVGHANSVLSVKYSPHGSQVASCSADKSVRVWDMETGFCRRILTGHTDWVRDIAYSPRGDLVASGSDDCTVKLWDIETGTCRQIFIGHTQYVFVVAYSPQGDQVASGGEDGSVKIWDIGSGECRHTMQGHTNDVKSIVYSPKGDQIASGSEDSTVRLWDIQSGVCLHTLSGHQEGVASTVYSPQRGLLASGSHDCTVRLWDVETGECRYILIGHTNSVVIVVYSPQGNQVASGGADGSVKLWDDGTGECLHTLGGHTEEVTSIVYSPKGDQIVSGSRDKTVRLWSVTSGQCQAVVQSFNGSIQSIAWSTTQEANYFVAGSEDGSVCMWEVEEEEGLYTVRPCWRSVNGELVLTDSLIHDVQGLSQFNKQLLKQRGAVGEPFVRLREASKKLMKMTSVFSALGEPPTSEVPEPPSDNSLAAEQSEQPVE
ncbi:MAG: WD40-repeat-containing domain protein [Benniella sp.]|nr:MAG: WD40-repeat-containing domain protein [Benniella sp.]